MMKLTWFDETIEFRERIALASVAAKVRAELIVLYFAKFFISETVTYIRLKIFLIIRGSLGKLILLNI